jgi:hypothetical protein
MIALQTVHTTGINWESLVPICVSIAASFAGAAKYIVGKVEDSRRKGQAANEKFVTGLVDGVSKMVDFKLETVNDHLKDQDTRQNTVIIQLADVRDRTSRIEGTLKAT